MERVNNLLPVKHRDGLVLTYTTQMCIEDGGLTPQQMAKMDDIYKRNGSLMVEWRKTFQDPKWEIPGWCNSVECAAAFFGRYATLVLALRTLEGQVDKHALANEERAVLITGQAAAKHDFPFYCVGRKLLEAAERTKPFTQWDLNHFPLPFECITFLLPKGWRFNGQPLTHFVVCDKVIMGRRRLTVLGLEGSLPIYIGVNEVEEDGTIDVEKCSRVRADAPSNTPQTTGVDDEQLKELSIGIMQLVLNLVGIMHARKEQVSEERVLRVVGKRQTEVKAPRILGLGYSYHTTSSRSGAAEPSGHTKGPHWRRGHWHTVVFGKGRSQRRLEWFEPVYVNAVH